MAKPIVYAPHTQYHLTSDGNIVTGLERLVDELQVVRFERTMSLILDKGFIVKLSKRQTSSSEAKKKAYAYHGSIQFLYGYTADRKVVNVYLNYKDDRSYKHFITSNIKYILQRAIQHFELDKSQLLVSEKLACWLK